MQTQTLQIFQYERVVLRRCARALGSRPSVRSRRRCQSALPDAVMHRAGLSQKGVSHPLCGSRCSYHFRAYRYPVELCPQGGSFLAQGVVVRDSRDPGVALFAVQPAAADQFMMAHPADISPVPSCKPTQRRSSASLIRRGAKILRPRSGSMCSAFAVSATRRFICA